MSNLHLTAAHLPAGFITRFAPSPTGYLHLGHVANAIYVWGLAQRFGGKVLLRIEDHDQGRYRPEYDDALSDDLAWLGLRPDDPTVYRQSTRDAEYARALDQVARTGLAFGCNCSRKEIADVMPAAGEELRYSGTCRDRRLPLIRTNGVRIEMEAGTETFADLVLGPQVQEPVEQCGDVLVRDRHGRWTYQWAVTVDDRDQDISVVIRGMDLLPSTGRQIRLARLIGRETPPKFLHHPLIVVAEGRKLSKRDDDTGVRELRAAGISPEDVLGRAAHLVGLMEQPRPIDAASLQTLFSS